MVDNVSRAALRVCTSVWLLVTLVACSSDGSLQRAEPTPPDTAVRVPTVTVDTTTRFQTMTGWEAVAQIGYGVQGFNAAQQSALFDAAVNDLGLNRIRLELRAGAENPVDYYAQVQAGQTVDWRAVRYATVNDNADPNVINAAGFQFTDLDENVERIVLPLRALLLARGERLHVNLCYVAFVTSSNGYVHEDPAEYAELLVAAFQHLRDKYQLTPDAVEMILEPDNTSMWRGTSIGRAMVATATRLGAAGFHPEFIGPSNTSMANAVNYFDELIQVPGVPALLKEISYHRYSGVSDANLRALAARATQYGIRTAMLEHINSDVEDLYRDLTLANASAWEQFALAFPTSDDGAQYYVWNNGLPAISRTARYLRQYFHYVRQGSVRVAAVRDSSWVRPVAFQHATRGIVVVMHLDNGGTLEIRGLSPGSYGANLTSEATAAQELGTFTASSAGVLRFSAPAAGVVSVYRK